MNYLIGRDNLAVTVYVPYDCANNCPFCTSKQEYAKQKMDKAAVIKALSKLVNHPDIKDVVITGGEPTADPSFLHQLVTIAKDKNVFINTTLPRKNFYDCLPIFNSGMVNGVNVSRHSPSFSEDAFSFKDIVDDNTIDEINVPVKINVVLSEITTPAEVKAIIRRWLYRENVTVCFRRDFRRVTCTNLHTLYGDVILDYLSSNYTFLSHTFCDVCDTITFEDRIMFHRGLIESSFEFGSKIVVNDIIIFPDGYIAYDWDGKPIHCLDGFMDKAKSVKKTPSPIWPHIPHPSPAPTPPAPSPTYSYSTGVCGGNRRFGCH